ncbi:MAG: hypothetical protein ACE5KM_09320 [Planctomycetaceae bacterium]
MRMIGILTLAVAVSWAGNSADAAVPNDPYGRGQWTKLVQDKAARKQLSLSDRQSKALNALRPAKDDNRAKIGSVLKPEQVKTLKRISWKALGGYAVFDDEVSDALEITDAQKTKLEAAAKTNQAKHRKMKSILALARFRSRAAMEKFIAGYRDAADQRLLAVLTKTQRAQLKKLVGGTA